MAHKIITKAEALKQGLPRYYTGTACPKGHLAERYVNSDKCIECHAERNKRRKRGKTGTTGKTIKSKAVSTVVAEPNTAKGKGLVGDYHGLPAATRADLSKRAARIKDALKRGLIEVGRELTEAKNMLNHGQFTAWVERETGLSIRTAQLIMSAYRLVSKNENFSLLSRSALFLLGAHDLPAGTINLLNERIEKGDVPSRAEVHQITRKLISKPSPVNLAVRMQEPPDKATVIDLPTYRVVSAVNASLAAAGPSEERQERLQDFHERIHVAEVAIMLARILDAGQMFQLVTKLRKAAPEATLSALAEALERTDAKAAATAEDGGPK